VLTIDHASKGFGMPQRGRCQDSRVADIAVRTLRHRLPAPELTTGTLHA